MARLRLRFGRPQMFDATPASDESAQMIANRLHDAVRALEEEGTQR